MPCKLVLDIDDKDWDKFKRLVPTNIRLKDAVPMVIKQFNKRGAMLRR